MSSMNVDTLRRCHEAFNRADFDEAASLLAETCTVTDHGRGVTVTDPAGFRAWLEGHFAMSSDIKVVDATYIDAGKTVIAQFRAEGMQDGPMDVFPASNRRFSIATCEVWSFNDNGQAVEGHNYSDSLGMLLQLGHIKAPETA